MTAGYGTAGQLATIFTLDAAGEPLAVTDGLGHTSYALPTPNDVLARTDPRGNTTTNAYAYVGPNGSTGLLTQTVAPPISAYTTSAATVDHDPRVMTAAPPPSPGVRAPRRFVRPGKTDPRECGPATPARAHRGNSSGGPWISPWRGRGVWTSQLSACPELRYDAPNITRREEGPWSRRNTRTTR